MRISACPVPTKNRGAAHNRQRRLDGCLCWFFSVHRLSLKREAIDHKTNFVNLLTLDDCGAAQPNFSNFV